MKQPEDTKTIDMLAPAKRGRGRPVTGCAMTGAERAKKYRLEKKAQGFAFRKVPVGFDAKTQARMSNLDLLEKLQRENAEFKRAQNARRFYGITQWEQKCFDLERENVELKKQVENLQPALQSVHEYFPGELDSLFKENKALKQQVEDLQFQLKGANALLGDYQRELSPAPVRKRK